MRARLLVALGSAALLAATALPSHAGTPVVDGKKNKGWSFKVAVTTQNNLAGDQAGPLVKQAGPSYGGAACKPPRCYKQTFVFSPARGVKGDVVVKAKWATPASDYDLYLFPAKPSSETDYVGHCGGSASNGEVMVVPQSALRAGKSYVLVVNFQQSYNDTVTGSLAFPATFATKAAPAHTIDETHPGFDESFTSVGCAIDGIQQ